MLRSWILILVLGVVAELSAVSSSRSLSSYDTFYDEPDASIQVPTSAKDDSPDDYDYGGQFHDIGFQDYLMEQEQKKYEKPEEPEIDELVGDESLPNDDDEKAVFEEIARLEKQIDGNNDESRLDDYQYEDNRSDAKVLDPKEIADDAKPDDDQNQEDEPAEDDSNFPDFKLDSSPASDEIIAEVNEILNEENSPSEEDIEPYDIPELKNNVIVSQEDDDSVEDDPNLLLGSIEEDEFPPSVEEESPEKSSELDDNVENNSNNNDQHITNENDNMEGSNESIQEKDNEFPPSIEQVSHEESFELDDIVEVNINDNDQHLSNENDHMDGSNEPIQETDEFSASFEEESQEQSAALDEPLDVIHENENTSDNDEKLFTDDNVDDKPNEFDENVNEEQQPDEQVNNNDENEQLASDEDDDETVASVEKDLNADLERLFDIWSRIRDESDENQDVLDYEEKYGKPFGESKVLDQRNYDYYEEDDNTNINSNFDDLFELEPKKEDNIEGNDNDDDPVQNNESIVKDVEIPYSDDALAPEQQTPEKDSEQIKPESENVNEDLDTTTFKSIDVEDLNPAQYDDLMKQFTMVHAEELDTQSDDFGQNIAPIHMVINADEVTEITSPNYPNAYPSNNVVDWILEADGTGFELNLTDFEVRGANGDYLLIKPGGAEDQTMNGIVFSYHLNEPRHFRFYSINRLLLRFVSGPGLGFLKGFRLTTKSIAPLSTFDPEPEPEPEPLLPPPPETVTIVVGGLTHEEFQEKKEEFRRLLADIATMYINANNIDMGDNKTSDVTQITSTAVCNIHWPDYENCVVITFGVPLVYEDGPSDRLNRMDLTAMWAEYSVQDPFSTRLRMMGIMEYAPPNDSSVLLLWLILGSGAVISAVLLALAVWRYSCFEDYTRMKPYGDTDSLRNEKPGLEDLYPTPHQTLPPLCGDNDYKWADAKYEDSTRVDMGGFTNRSYVRDDLFMESDEDDVTSRVHNKYTTDV